MLFTVAPVSGELEKLVRFSYHVFHLVVYQRAGHIDGADVVYRALGKLLVDQEAVHIEA
jgi:hypothetical protein